MARRPNLSAPKAVDAIVFNPAEAMRFYSSIEVRPKGCWEWKRGRDENGYGFIKFRGKKWWVHRLAYAAHKRSLRDGDQVDHACDNPSCCNPAHLRRMKVADHCSASGRKKKRIGFQIEENDRKNEGGVK